MNKLPEEILSNILSRLPVKCLLRFECVSKPWLSLIKSPEFAHLHLHQQQSNSSSTLIVFSGTKNPNALNNHGHSNRRFNLYSFDIDSPNPSVVKLPLPTIFRTRSSHKSVVGSCNGVLCLRVDGIDQKQLILINPSVMSFFEVPNPPYPENYGPRFNESWGFGYDSVMHDYKVFRILNYFVPTTRVQFMIYSLKANTWKLICERTGSFNDKRINGVLIGNNLLHWFQWNDNFSKHEIVIFDLNSEKWSQVKIPFPSNYLQWLNGETVVDLADFVTLGTLDGCLCLLVRNLLKEFCDVWVLKEYGTENQRWVKLFDDSDGSLTRSLLNTPIVYNWRQRDKILLSNSENSRLCWYNERDKSFRDVETRVQPPKRGFYVCLKSLVYVPGGQQFGAQLIQQSAARIRKTDIHYPIHFRRR